MRATWWMLRGAAGAWAALVASATTASAAGPGIVVDYHRDIKPLLKTKCVSCHGHLKQKAGLRLDAGRLIHTGAKGEAVLTPGDGERGALIERVTDPDPEFRMPPEEQGSALTEHQVALLKAWIAQGATYPTDEPIAARPEDHWAFQPIVRPQPPNVRDGDWPLNAIDRFVLAALEQRGWTPNGPAEPHALLRRVYLDVIGLPPTPEQVDAFLNDARPDAFERVVDELLAGPHYGERFARRWLDVVRYADSNGYERDGAKPDVWRYRDYVIRSLNDDKPFDRFVVEQLAGDELPDATGESVIATGFNRLGPWDDEPADFDVDRFDQLDDIINTTGQALLGLTMGCARCHDHKFDPLSQRDYYSMAAVFNGLVRPRDGRTELTRYAAPPGVVIDIAQRDRRIAELSESAKVMRERADEESKRRLAVIEAEIAEQQARFTDVKRGYFMFEPSPTPPATHILLRGNPHNRGDEVGPAVPAVLVARQPPFMAPDEHTTRRRLSFAQWVVAEDNPLTARVIVNRVWQWHFGEGLVRTPNDFGLQGDSPTHPALLDYLAHWFVHEAEWSLKKLHRLILTSRAYRMSRASREDYAVADPENRLLWRQSYRRLEAEAIRDSMLAVSGRLDRTMYGPPIHPYIPAEALANHTDKESIWPAYDEAAASRRTVYVFIKRSLVVPMLEVLDLCDTTQSSPKRAVTTVPTQALTLYNGFFVNRQAQHLAGRLRREAGDDVERQIDRLWRLALCRPPSNDERAAARRFVDAQLVPLREAQPDADEGALRQQAMSQLCRVVFNLNEFVYTD